ncbi:TetR/AcrR family transcriptional regulator [Mucilaginibacter sp.]|jgi:AcrR family transcriptional regulator|uniref:TetR/AcrR family transcriptional regulator n=1 Tax=Mucilaginibacter sp. TaxID=1882438 RepID=UPI00356B423A
MSKGEETKKLIIEKSAAIVNVKGIAATSMSDIMSATKLSKGTLYMYFNSKDDLACSAVEHNLELLSSKIQHAIKKHKTAKDKLFAYLDLLEDPINTPVDGGCPMINSGTEADDTNPGINAIVNVLVERSQQLISSIIQKGIKNGEFKSDWDYHEFSTMMFALLEGGTIICRSNGNNEKMKVINNSIKRMITAQLL